MRNSVVELVIALIFLVILEYRKWCFQNRRYVLDCKFKSYIWYLKINIGSQGRTLMSK